MRFSDLRIGDHFLLDGLEYTKTSPLLASDSKGKSKFIPRYAGLEPLVKPHSQTRGTEYNELDRLYTSVITIIRQEVSDNALQSRLCQAIERAWHKVKSDVG